MIPRLFLLLCAAFVCAAEPRKPNLIFILSDDLAQGDLGCYGQKPIQTPNLDRMAAEGTKFTQGYCGTSVCAPSRTSLMLGQHTGHSPIRANRELEGEGQLPIPAESITVAKALKADANEKNDLADKRPDLVEKALTIFKDAHVDHPEWPMRSLKQMQDANKARKTESK